MLCAANVVGRLIVCYICFCLLFVVVYFYCLLYFFFLQAEDGIRDLVRSRGLGDVYKRQFLDFVISGLLLDTEPG